MTKYERLCLKFWRILKEKKGKKSQQFEFEKASHSKHFGKKSSKTKGLYEEHCYADDEDNFEENSQNYRAVS